MMETNHPSIDQLTMLIPLNCPQRKDLCLSVIELKSGYRYSVAIMSIINGYGLDSLPSYSKYYLDNDAEGYAPVATMEDFAPVTGNDLYACIEECMRIVRRYFICSMK